MIFNSPVIRGKSCLGCSSNTKIRKISETRLDLLKVEWEIGKFLSLPGSVGSFVDSPEILFSDASWILRVYPYGDKERDRAVGLYLILVKIPASCSSTVIFTMAVKKADGTFYSRNPMAFKFHESTSYGDDNILAISDLKQKKDEFLPGDTLTFSCILRKAPPVEAIDVLSANFSKLLVSSAHSDVTVKVQSREYLAHRAILAAQSDVFASALEHDTLERESGVIPIEDCDSDSFEEFLRYLYTGRAHIEESNVFHLFKTADKYLVGELKAMCVAYLMDNMSVDNLCDAVAFADDYSILSLKVFCNKFFSDNFVSVLGTQNWLSLMKERNVVANKLLQHFSKKVQN